MTGYTPLTVDRSPTNPAGLPGNPAAGISRAAPEPTANTVKTTGATPLRNCEHCFNAAASVGLGALFHDHMQLLSFVSCAYISVDGDHSMKYVYHLCI